MRSVIDYPAPVFHHALPAYLSLELERVQKRAMRIICPGMEYQQALALMSLTTVFRHFHQLKIFEYAQFVECEEMKSRQR